MPHKNAHSRTLPTRRRRQRHKTQSWRPPFQFVGCGPPSIPISIWWQRFSLCPAVVLLLSLNSGRVHLPLRRRPLFFFGELSSSASCIFTTLCNAPREHLPVTDSRSRSSPPTATVGYPLLLDALTCIFFFES
jgi:hypothetical protein